MSDLLSPPSPELDEQHLASLAYYAKHLGKAPLARRFTQKIGEHITRQKGHGMEMLELRQYQLHDDPRHIDWRVSARTGELHTRLYSQEHDQQKCLLVDLSDSAYFGTRHTFIATRLIQVAALIAWRCQQKKQGLSYQLQFGQHSKQGSGKTPMAKLLMELGLATLIKNREDSSQSQCVWRLPFHQQQIRNQDIFILTDKQSWTPEDDLKLQQLAQHNRVYWLQVLDTNMFNLPSGQYQLADHNGISSLSINYQSQTLARQAYQQENTHMTQHLAKLGVCHQAFDLSQAPENIARSLLAMGALH
ncbi:DUF58 domain-containing protein [Marinomonas epiphytica]